MSDGLFSPVELGASDRVGYRLDRLELFNWGTFDRRVWRLSLAGDSTLLTGDIGSGKSTLIDAVTTLLLPAHKIFYNKAAGADAKERTLRSYVEGHYKSESVESTGRSRPVALRDGRSYSVILGVFVNEGYDETVTLAQVFQQRQPTGQPDRFYVTATKALGIEADFTDFGADLNDLRRRLRASGAQLFQHGEYPKYATSCRRLLGIRSEQAMELFHQTVSMKSVGNLNEFVRKHMLEQVDADERVRGIIGHFDDLTKAHDAVRRARDQLQVLQPLVATAEGYDAALQRRSGAERQRDAVRLFVTELRIALLADEIEANSRLRIQQTAGAEQHGVELAALARAREGLIEERAVAGGDRVGELERLLRGASAEAEQRRERRTRFDARVEAAHLPPVSDAAAFAGMRNALSAATGEAADRRRSLDAQVADVAGRLADVRRASHETRAELTSLASRSSNLPSSQLAVRSQLCDDLGIDEPELPFAGELLDVADEFSQWRGAAERVLRPFALSLLVPQHYYDRVSRWVNARRLTYRRTDGSVAGSRLVYERVADRRVRLQPAAASDVLLLAQTLQVADGPFHDYLSDEVVRRADYRCVDSIEQFGHERRAVTREGQVRSGDRHEKDDRSKSDDPRAWVLGWANQRKVDALTAQLGEQQQQLDALEQERDRLGDERDSIGVRLSALSALEDYPAWSELDWQEAASRADDHDAERQRLLSGSSTLSEIERRLAENADQTVAVTERHQALRDEIARLDDRIERGNDARRHDEAFVAGVPDPVAEQARAVYPLLTERVAGDAPASPDACQPLSHRLTDELDATIRRTNTELGGYAQSLMQYMGEFRKSWPEAATDLDVSVEARHEYVDLHDRVADDDLPRFEEEFKRQLNTNTIRELAGFHVWLKRQADDIDVRVARINEALGAIDYAPGRYITLVKEGSDNQEVREFRTELRNATTDALAPDDDHYTEQRFVDVQRIIERFRGREGHTEADKAWTRRVTDVRNWFTFSASERDRETDEEWEHYRDSDGKSGGQKEKLAYTILAASLAYQFGLEWGVERSKDFRFAVIDEAFGRGSDASTRYALELFAKLGLQLLIVTPLQKVRIIEPYVRAIGFVDNPESNFSRLRTLTIEEYRTGVEQP